MFRTVESISNVINKKLNKIMPTRQKTENERTTVDPVVELKAKPVSIIFGPRTQTKGRLKCSSFS